jgi:PAS domain S-box-containing protein
VEASSTPPPLRRARRSVILVAVALFAAVTGLRYATSDPGDATTLLFAVPIALVAVETGLVGGALAAGASFASFAIWTAVENADIEPLGFFSRAVSFGVVGALVGMFADRSRVAQRRSDERFELLVDRIDDYAILLLDVDGRVMSWNRGAARLTGYRAEEIIGQPFSTFYPRDEKASGLPEDLLRRAVAEGSVEDEGRRRRKDGSRFFASTSITVLLDNDGRPRGFADVTRDVSRRRHQEEALQAVSRELGERARELERSNEELEQFASIASHDLSEPLRTISGFASLLGSRYSDRLDERGNEFLGHIVTAANRMQRLIEALLVYSRVGRRALVRERIDTEEVVREVVRGLDARLADTGGTVEIATLPAVTGDRLQLSQLFQNLISNALKFRGDARPVVRVSAEREDGGWRFDVVDNGVGITEEAAKRIFEPFQRAHGQEVEGTGIGLAICAKIVSNHGGRIWVEPAHEGGAAFRFTLRDDDGSRLEEPAG